MPPKADTIAVTFVYVRDTKNKVRFNEEGSQNLIGALYLSKSHYEKLGKPEKLSVSVAAA